jgi:hydroxymethylbilane synthase
MDAILLALAGLNRLGLGHRATSVLNAKEWLPALAQGAIGIEVRDDDLRTRELVAALDHAPTAIALACERAFQEALDGSCRSPIGGLATVQNNHLEFRGEVLSPNGKFCAETQITLALGTDAKAEAEAARAGREAGVALRPRAAAWLDL